MNPELVGIFDIATGKTVRLLAIQHETSKLCCPVLGWLGEETVLISGHFERLLAWNFRTGDLTRVAETPGYRLSIADVAMRGR